VKLQNNTLLGIILGILNDHPNGLSVKEITNEVNNIKQKYSRPRVSQILSELIKQNLANLEKKGRQNIYRTILEGEMINNEFVIKNYE